MCLTSPHSGEPTRGTAPRGTQSRIQQLLTTFNYRVHDPDVVKANAAKFPSIRLINPNDVLGSWEKIQSTHFGSNGILDQLLAQKR